MNEKLNSAYALWPETLSAIFLGPVLAIGRSELIRRPDYLKRRPIQLCGIGPATGSESSAIPLVLYVVMTHPASYQILAFPKFFTTTRNFQSSKPAVWTDFKSSR